MSARDDAIETGIWKSLKDYASRVDVAEFIASLRAAGYAVVRDVGELDSRLAPMASPGQGVDVELAWERGYEEGYNACRAAMIAAAEAGE